MRVAQAMTRQPLVLSVNDWLARAVELILTSAQADFPVTENGKLVGILSEVDLLKGLSSGGAEMRVGQAMRQGPLAAPGDLVFDTQQKISKGRVRAVPVVERDGRVVGMLTQADINEAYRLLSLNQSISPVTSQV